MVVRTIPGMRGLYCAECGVGEWSAAVFKPMPQVTSRWKRHIDAGHPVMALTTAEYEVIFGPPRGRAGWKATV